MTEAKKSSKAKKIPVFTAKDVEEARAAGFEDAKEQAVQIVANREFNHMLSGVRGITSRR